MINMIFLARRRAPLSSGRQVGAQRPTARDNLIERAAQSANGKQAATSGAQLRTARAAARARAYLGAARRNCWLRACKLGREQGAKRRCFTSSSAAAVAKARADLGLGQSRSSEAIPSRIGEQPSTIWPLAVRQTVHRAEQTNGPQ